MSPRCECGGTLRKATLRDYDFSPFAGLEVTLTAAPGYRCSRCKGETLDGEVIEAVLDHLTFEVLKLDRALSPDEARYLRKRLGLTQRGLAERMHVTRETVAFWESGKRNISDHNEFILRTLVFVHEQTHVRMFDLSQYREHALPVYETLTHVRRQPARARAASQRFVIDPRSQRRRKAATG